MAMFEVFRADKRQFQVAEVIYTAGEFAARNPNGIELEALFAKSRPEGKPARCDTGPRLSHPFEAKSFGYCARQALCPRKRAPSITHAVSL